MGERQSSDSRGESLDELPRLVARLGDDLVTLIESRLGLLKVEIQEEATAYVRGVLSMAVGGVVAAVGFGLLNVGLAFFLAQALASTNLAAPIRFALGFLLLGVTYLLVGLGLVKRAERGVARSAP